MTGALGPYPMSREASGTAWQPDASIHGGAPRQAGDWMLMGHAALNVVYDWQEGPRGGEHGLRLRHGDGHGAARLRRRHAAVPRDAEPRSADGPARLSAAPRRRRDRGRRHAAGRPPASARFLHGAVGELQPPPRPTDASLFLYARPARRARFRPARLHAPHVDHGFARSADHPSLAGFDPHHLRRGHRRPGRSATSSSKARASTAASPTSVAGTSRPARSIRPRCASPGTRPRTCRCRRAGRIWSAPSSSSRTRTDPLVGERDLHAADRRGRLVVDDPRLGPARRRPTPSPSKAPSGLGLWTLFGRAEHAENDELTFAGGHHGPRLQGRQGLARRDPRFPPRPERPARPRRPLCAATSCPRPLEALYAGDPNGAMAFIRLRID